MQENAGGARFEHASAERLFDLAKSVATQLEQPDVLQQHLVSVQALKKKHMTSNLTMSVVMIVIVLLGAAAGFADQFLGLRLPGIGLLYLIAGVGIAGIGLFSIPKVVASAHHRVTLTESKEVATLLYRSALRAGSDIETGSDRLVRLAEVFPSSAHRTYANAGWTCFKGGRVKRNRPSQAIECACCGAKAEDGIVHYFSSHETEDEKNGAFQWFARCEKCGTVLCRACSKATGYLCPNCGNASGGWDCLGERWECCYQEVALLLTGNPEIRNVPLRVEVKPFREESVGTAKVALIDISISLSSGDETQIRMSNATIQIGGHCFVLSPEPGHVVELAGAARDRTLVALRDKMASTRAVAALCLSAVKDPDAQAALRGAAAREEVGWTKREMDAAMAVSSRYPGLSPIDG